MIIRLRALLALLILTGALGIPTSIGVGVLSQGPFSGSQSRQLPGRGIPTTFQERLAVAFLRIVDWRIACVGCAKQFDYLSEDSLRLDEDGRPHIVYGGDHLYYAAHDGTRWVDVILDGSPAVGHYAALALDTDGRPHVAYYEHRLSEVIKYAHWTGSHWRVEILDPDVHYTSYPPNVEICIELDGDGHPHVSYLGGDVLKHAWHDGARWQIEVVESVPAYGARPSLELDAAGNPHLTYRRRTPGEFDYELRYARREGATWYVETVTRAKSLSDTSLALDASGKPHVGYALGSPDNSLNYTQRTRSGWITQMIDKPGTNVSSVALRLDDLNRPHISYAWIDYPMYRLSYTHWTGSSWQVEHVDNSEHSLAFGRHHSLALDNDARPHVVYLMRDQNFGANELRYAYSDGSGWEVQTLAKEDLGGREPSLALDSQGYAHISHIGAGLDYAHWNGSAWSTEKVDFVGMWANTSLALDSSDNPHIAYVRSGDAGVEASYIHWDGHAWQRETIAALGRPEYPSLVLDADDHPHIAACVDDSLRYAQKISSAWAVRTIEADVPYCRRTSLVLDKLGRPHVSYGSNEGVLGGGNLNYARWSGSEWHTQTVVSEGAGLYNSLALDAADKPHISFYNETADSLQYAFWTGSEWRIRTVDSGFWGGVSSLALDAQGRAYISYEYRPYSNRSQLKVARWTGAAWQDISVDSTGDVAWQSSLALDADGYPHVAYSDEANDDLKYARLLPPLLLSKHADPSDDLYNKEALTYTLTLSGPGLNAHLWDPLPSVVRYVTDTLTSTLTPPAVYSPTAHAIAWAGVLPTGASSSIRFRATPRVTGTAALSLSLPIVNTAWLTDTDYERTVSATAIVNGEWFFMPLLMRQR